MDRQAILDYLEHNERQRQRRRQRIRDAVGRPMTDREVERVVALATGLEALYGLGEPQDPIICRHIRKHPSLTIDQALDHATWTFVAR